VVNYTVEVNTDNSSGRLLPYLTANVQFEVARRENVMTVPNAAMRWSPSSAELVAPDARAEYEERIAQSARSRGGVTSRDVASRPSGPRTGMVWVKEGDRVRPVRGEVGLSDGNVSEFRSDALTDGTEIVIGELASGSSQSSRSPFAPTVFGRGRRSGS
jgi:HlyD family secretion protein